MFLASSSFLCSPWSLVLELEPFLKREVKNLDLGAKDSGMRAGADGRVEPWDARSGVPFAYFLHKTGCQYMMSKGGQENKRRTGGMRGNKHR